MQPDETNEERLEQLPEDNQRPFTPADTGTSSPSDDTLPATDSDIDSTELYQDGVSNPDTSAQNGVAGYDPERDQRK